MSDEAISFKGTKNTIEKPYTPPGVIDVFDIKSVEYVTSKEKQTPGAKVFFDRKDDQFNHTFHITEKALPRLKELLRNGGGIEINDDTVLTKEQIKRTLEGKKVALKTIGKIDQSTGKGYVDLGMGGFSKPADQISFLEFTSKEEDIIKATKDAQARSSSQPDDVGGSAAGATNPDGTPKKKW